MLIRWYCALAHKHAGKLVLGMGLLTLLALSQAIRLGLNTDMAELLSNDHPGVVALRKLNGRQQTSTHLVILVSAEDDKSVWEFKKQLQPALQTLVPRVFTSVQWSPDQQIHNHAMKWRWLYAEKEDLESAESLLDRLISKRGNPMMVDLEGDPDEDLKALRQRLMKQMPAVPIPVFETPKFGPYYMGVVLWKKGSGFATLGDAESLRETQKVVDALNPSSFGHGLKVEYTGGVAMSIEESNAVREDLTIATTTCVALVLLIIYLYFRRLAVLLVIGSPAVMGLMMVLALARHHVGELNANTAFLLSIILGNGINAPIILLARFGEERRQGRPLMESVLSALRSTILGTGAAMLAASVAYGSLLATSLRGLNQFGLIGGGGMILVWLSSLLLMPPMVFLGERWKPGVLTSPPPSLIWRRPFEWIGNWVERHPKLPALVALGLTLVALVPVAKWLRDPYEWNLNKLRTTNSEAQKRWSRMYDVIGGGEVAGYIATDGIIFVDKPEQADQVAEALREKDRKRGKDNVLRTVRTLSSLVPKDQDEKLEILARIRKKIDRHHEMMSAEEAKEADEWRPPEYLRPITADDLPPRVLSSFTEVDGTRGRFVGIDVEFNHYNDQKGRDLLVIAHAMEVDALGQHWVAAAASTVFAGMLEVILQDGPKVTLIALIGVMLLLLGAFRWGALPVMGSLVIGIIWLLAVVALIGERINFLNFVALPITLGVAADYGANIWARLRRDGQVREAIVETGSAVALCSATTIIGYSSLLLAHNGALRSFGVIADIGEVTCLVAAFLILPAVLRKRKTAAPPGEATGS